MKRHNGLIATLGLLLAIGFLGGCAKMPQDAMDDARAALDSAKTVEAERYAQEMYQAAVDSMAAAEAEIEAQASKMATSRSYTRARQLLNSVVTSATAAFRAAPDRKEQMRAEVEAILAEVPKTVTSVNRLIQRASRSRATRDAANAAREAIAGIDQMLAEARTALEQGDVRTAHDRASQAKQAVENAQKQVS